MYHRCDVHSMQTINCWNELYEKELFIITKEDDKHNPCVKESAKCYFFVVVVVLELAVDSNRSQASPAQMTLVRVSCLGSLPHRMIPSQPSYNLLAEVARFCSIPTVVADSKTKLHVRN